MRKVLAHDSLNFKEITMSTVDGKSMQRVQIDIGRCLLLRTARRELGERRGIFYPRIACEDVLPYDNADR